MQACLSTVLAEVERFHLQKFYSLQHQLDQDFIKLSIPIKSKAHPVCIVTSLRVQPKTKSSIQL